MTQVGSIVCTWSERLTEELQGKCSKLYSLSMERERENLSHSGCRVVIKKRFI